MSNRLVYILCLFVNVFLIEAQNYCAFVKLHDDRSAYIDTLGKITYLEEDEIKDRIHISSYLFPIKNGIGRLRHNEIFTFIDSNGKSIFGIDFEKAENFNEGMAEVRVKGKWGFINVNGEMVIQPQFFDSHKFSCGLSVVSQKGSHGYMNTKGQIVIIPQFDRVCHFVDNKAWVLKDGKWGCINKMGVYLIAPHYSDTKDFSEGYAWVNKDRLWGLVDSVGNYLIAPDDRNPLIYGHNATFKIFGNFNNGLIISKVNNKVGYCDKTLKKVIPAKFEKAFDFQNGFACVKIDGLWGIIDTTGGYRVEPKFNDIKLGLYDLYPAKNDNDLWGYINSKSEWVIKPQFNNAYSFQLLKN